MVIQLAKFKNPEHEFYCAYLQPVKAACKEKKEYPELVDFVLPKEAQILINEQGLEQIHVNGMPVQILTDAFTGIVYLVNNETYLKMEKHRVGEAARVIPFPINKADLAVG